MATLCISALSPGATHRHDRLIEISRGLAENGEKVDFVFYGSGLYCLVEGSKSAEALAASGASIYAVADDVENRGLAGRLMAQADLVSYDKIVDMIMVADRTITGI